MKPRQVLYPSISTFGLNRSLFLFLLALQFFSCVSNEKLIYLQNLEGNEPIPEDALIGYTTTEYQVQYNDVLDVKIQTVDPEMNELFNISGGQNMMQAGRNAESSGGDIFYLTGHTVDKEGNIELPLLGEVFVMDMTLKEIKTKVHEDLKKYMTNDDYYVRVKLGGIRFSTLGEFRRPNKYVVLQDRMTILEAISLSGDLNVSAKRDEILLIRQYPEGTKLHRVNLNDRNLVNSPYYFIQPNDQLYAEPMRIRELGSGENLAQSISLLVTSVTAAALILNLILN
ncbi:MAG: polysaccharide biosynthesis/export family protein [Cyclobacterium sp.]|uniref:polysaccharide biosynthesis/export family protein n=1 Tax=unclassified Cyclobacterium TaxID=2615055 RepID=UPI001F09EBB3|nr:polysaccharide biosynthesis/export family protein [Cyclobacterium sp. SYSU L10401]